MKHIEDNEKIRALIKNTRDVCIDHRTHESKEGLDGIVAICDTCCAMEVPDSPEFVEKQTEAFRSILDSATRLMYLLETAANNWYDWENDDSFWV